MTATLEQPVQNRKSRGIGEGVDYIHDPMPEQVPNSPGFHLWRDLHGLLADHPTESVLEAFMRELSSRKNSVEFISYGQKMRPREHELIRDVPGDQQWAAEMRIVIDPQGTE